VSQTRRREVERLSSCATALVGAYDVVMFDLDGVVYRGTDPVEGAARQLARLRTGGTKVAYVTNNASRTPEQVAEHLIGMGVKATPADVVTSAQAVARLLADRLPAGAKVLTIGAAGLDAAVHERGLTVVRSLSERPEAVVQGFGPTVDWTALAEAAHAINSGLPWFASNTDRTIPTARGTAPGNGMLVAAVRAAVDVDPIIAGKPEPALFDETVIRVGGTHPLVVGDRLDTDIAGANLVGADSMLVLTGVSGLPDLAMARPAERPTFVAPTLASLSEPHPVVDHSGPVVHCAGWTAHVHEDVVHVEAADRTASALALVRAAVSAAWHHVDATGVAADMRKVDDHLSTLSGR
jgi:HAD superfamily hydrolase (TIGR01450 family)